ncbi:MAG: Gfo/Idh/MocA family oxidoreductase, partial [Ignavibacteria bacterium]|nr:Gfo/Idh/MocA family oxidoreductase [Ignavibacteria bacterium]
MKKIISLGIAGAGAVFRHMHYPALLKLKGRFRISSVYDPSPDARRKFRQVHGKEPFRFLSSPGDLLDSAAVDAIAVLTPTGTHTEYTLRALNSGKNVFLEKPVSVSPLDVKKIMKAEKQTRRFVQVGMVLRYSSFFRAVGELVNGGRYGKVLWMNWIETRPFDPMQWRYVNTEKNGDAVVFDKAVHQFNLFNAFSGSKPEEVMAMGGQYMLSKSKTRKLRAFSNEVPLKGESCDHFMAMIRYRNNVKASITVSYVSPHARESRWVIQLEKAKVIAHFETFADAAPGSRRKWKGNPSSIYLFKDDSNYPVVWKY